MVDGKGMEENYDITTDVLVRPSPIDAMDSERIRISTGVDDGRWTYTVWPLVAVAIGVVVGLAGALIITTSTYRSRWLKENHHY